MWAISSQLIPHISLKSSDPINCNFTAIYFIFYLASPVRNLRKLLPPTKIKPPGYQSNAIRSIPCPVQQDAGIISIAIRMARIDLGCVWIKVTTQWFQRSIEITSPWAIASVHWHITLISQWQFHFLIREIPFMNTTPFYNPQVSLALMWTRGHMDNSENSDRRNSTYDKVCRNNTALTFQVPLFGNTY